MGLPAIVRSAHTWDTQGNNDLRQNEEAILVEVEDLGLHGYRLWRLIPLDRPRLIELSLKGSVEDVLRKWLKPA